MPDVILDPSGSGPWGENMKVSTESKRSKALHLAAVLGMFVLPFTAYADDGDTPVAEKPATAAPAGTTPPASQDQLQTILVTATKRETSVQQTPISITAVTNEE